MSVPRPCRVPAAQQLTNKCSWSHLCAWSALKFKIQEPKSLIDKQAWGEVQVTGSHVTEVEEAGGCIIIHVQAFFQEISKVMGSSK